MLNKVHQKTICVGIFAAMFVFLLLQFHNVMVYFDDYGYYSLSYGVSTTAGGHEFTFLELFSYLKVHYFDVNGRIPGYVVWLSLYIIGGLRLVQTSAAIFVFLILFAIWKFVEEHENPIASAILVCSFYGLISLEMHRQGTYWFAAFFQYVAPVSAIIAFTIIYFKEQEGAKSVFSKILSIVLVFISAYSQEQLAVTVSFMMVLLILLELIRKNLNVWNFAYLLVAVMCVAGLLLSPSAQNRASASPYSTYETIIYSTYNTIRTFYASDISELVILIHIALFAFSLKLFRKDNVIFKLIDLCGIALAVGTILIYMCTPIRDILAKYTFHRYYVLIVVGVPCIAVLAIQIMRYYWSVGEYKRLILFMTAVGSIGCLCFVPETPARLFISGWLLLFPTLSNGVFTLIRLMGNKFNSLKSLAVACTIIAIFALHNSISIYQGYVTNAEAFKYNDEKFTEAANIENAGGTVEEIYLRQMPNHDCGAAMIYDWEVTYMKHWIRAYYGLSSNPTLYFNDLGTAPTSTESYVDQGENIYLVK